MAEHSWEAMHQGVLAEVFRAVPFWDKIMCEAVCKQWRTVLTEARHGSVGQSVGTSASGVPG